MSASCASISIPELPEADRRSAGRVPSKSHGGSRRSGDRVRLFGIAVLVPVEYWTPTSAASGRPRSRHCRVLSISAPAPLDAPEEVVRGEEREVAAAGRGSARSTSYACVRHVLVVPREDDQVVGAREPVAARDALEVVVGEKVDALARLREPAQEPQVVAAEVRRHAAVEERAARVDAVRRAGRVPGVADAVSVVVAEVVGLPGVASAARRRRGARRAAAGGRRTARSRLVRPALAAARSRARSASRRSGPAADARIEHGRRE